MTLLPLGPFNNYVTPRGGRGVKGCVTARSQHNVKKALRNQGVTLTFCITRPAGLVTLVYH